MFGQISTTTGGNGSYADIPGVVLGLAEDGSRLYALEASAPAEEVNPTCTTTDPCEIQQIPRPGPLKREPRKPSSPFV